MKTPEEIMARAILTHELVLHHSASGAFDEHANAAIEALKDAGFVIVPREPSEAMLEQFCRNHKVGELDKYGEECIHIRNNRRRWEKMIAALEQTDVAI